jgi:hypothetical protein
LIGKGTFGHVYTGYKGIGLGRVSVTIKSIIPATMEEASWFSIEVDTKPQFMIDSSPVTQHALQVCTTHQPSVCLPFACAGTKHHQGSGLLESLA